MKRFGAGKQVADKHAQETWDQQCSVGVPTCGESHVSWGHKSGTAERVGSGRSLGRD